MKKMVSTDKALESKYLTAEFVKLSLTKKLVVIGEGNYENVTYDNETTERLSVPVQIDGKDKIWRPNRDSVSNMNAIHSCSDTKGWVGKTAKVSIMKVQGKDSIVVMMG